MGSTAFDYERDIAPLSYFAGRICHDLNNLITSSMGAASLLELKLSMQPQVNLSTEIERVNKSISNYRTFTQRLGQIFFEVSETRISVNPNIVLKSACEQLPRDIELVLLQGDEKVSMEPSQIAAAIKEIVLNAIEASSDDQPITLRAEPVAGKIRITCEDRGRGIKPELLPRLFTPFFSEGKRGNLVGLGLPQAGYILHQHGSTVKISSEPGQGTIVSFDLDIT